MSHAVANPGAVPPGVEWPPKADLGKDVYRPLLKVTPGTVDLSSVTADMPTVPAQAAPLAYLTFSTPSTITASLLYLKNLRGVAGAVELASEAHFAAIRPVMMFIDCPISFRTTSPALDCVGKMILLPVKNGATGGVLSWKIWVLSTWVENIVQHPENETL
ncbi:hypothetical protein Hte_010946 [Hypoxylon texense]